MTDSYIIDVETFDKLKAINKRLFDDRPLSGDQRRDLANLMFVLLDSQHAMPWSQEDK